MTRSRLQSEKKKVASQDRCIICDGVPRADEQLINCPHCGLLSVDWHLLQDKHSAAFYETLTSRLRVREESTAAAATTTMTLTTFPTRRKSSRQSAVNANYLINLLVRAGHVMDN